MAHSQDESSQIVIIGAGPAGLLLAHYLLARSNKYRVSIYDKRSDPRDSGRSKRAFVIGLTQRGQQALKAIDGLWPVVRKQGVEIRKTAVYSKKLAKWQSFQRNDDPDIFSLLINRNNLCIALLDELEKRASSNLNLVFNALCIDVNLKAHKVKLAVDGNSFIEQSYNLLVGADGVRSSVRGALMEQPGFDFQQKYFDVAWKVMHIPRPVNMAADTSYFFRTRYPVKGSKYKQNRLSGAAIPEVEDNLCILMFWNQDPTVLTGNPPKIDTSNDLQKMISEQWLPDLHISDQQAEEFCVQRPSTVVETKCSRYHDTQGQAVLIGDAAHAMSSYLGQGCQAAFNDVVVLDRLLQEEADNLSIVLPRYSEQQVREGHAITDLNTQLAPRAKWLVFLLNTAMGIRSKLSKRFPQWISPPFFSLLSQTTMPYSEIARLFKPWMRLINWSNEKMLVKVQQK